ncbi:MAG TPA: pepsin-like aspartic protease [Myxococcota bacterium]|nr:pepsin-like aspartic protease [Myxococcota bacterium]
MQSSLSGLALLLSALLTSCSVGNRGRSECATPLTYVTNKHTSGEQALKGAALYVGELPVGSSDTAILAIIDTASANLVVNEKSFDFGDDTVTGRRDFIFDNGHAQSVTKNAKDDLDIACVADFPVRFSLTAKERPTPNYLGLAFKDSKRHPHEAKSVSFFDQLVRREDFDNVFSLALCGVRGNSRVVLGGIDDRMISLVGHFIPMMEKTAYVVPAVSLRRGDTKKVLGEFPLYDTRNQSGTRTIIDSTSAFLMLPSAMATALASEIESVANGIGLLPLLPPGFFRTERFNAVRVAQFHNLAQLRQFPPIEITFIGADGKIKALEISPLRYLKEMDNTDPMQRTFAVREATEDIILGQPFLESHYMFFDRKNGRIGFANIDIACAD